MWNSIMKINWFENMSEFQLNSEIRFIGLFERSGVIYGIGDDPLDSSDNVSKIYKLHKKDKIIFFEPLVKL